MTIWGSNAHSNQTPISTYTAYSNVITPLTQWTSNALSNYSPIGDRYWTFSNSVITTASNVSIIGQLRIQNDNPTITLSDTNGRTGYIHMNDNLMHFICGSNNSPYGSWVQVGGQWPMTINMSNLAVNMGGTLDVVGRVKASNLLLGTSTDSTRWITALNSNVSNNTVTYGVSFGKANSSWNQAELGYGHISDGNTSNYLSFGLHTSPSMALTGQGRLGIGTTSPAAQLHTTGNAILNNVSIGVVGNLGATWAGFAHSNRMSESNYALLQNNSGKTIVNSAAGQTTVLAINNNEVAGLDNERLYLFDKTVSELGGGQTKQINDCKIVSQKWTNYLEIVGTNGSTSGTRHVKIYDVLNVGSTNYSSDSNLKKTKEKIQPLGRMLDKLADCEGKTFEWKEDKQGRNKYKQGRQVGLLAQEVQKLCPEAVSEMDQGLTYDQTALNGVLIQLIKDLKDEIDGLKKRIKN
jgi:hypothetical protein